MIVFNEAQFIIKTKHEQKIEFKAIGEEKITLLQNYLTQIIKNKHLN
jgi:hypothetical protein